MPLSMGPMLTAGCISLCYISIVTCMGDGDTSNAAVYYANTLGGFLSRSCMYGFGISAMTSTYDSTKKDRLWKIYCKQVSPHGEETCKWTYAFVNDYEERLDFSCEDDYYIAGMFSYYNSSLNDRKWRIECCKSPRVSLKNCKNTSFSNTFRGDLSMELPPSKVLKGMISYYDRTERDRKWRFGVCTMRRDKPSRQGDHIHG